MVKERRKLPRFFFALGNNLEKYFPYLAVNLEQIGIKERPSEFIGRAFMISFFIFIISSLILTIPFILFGWFSILIIVIFGLLIGSSLFFIGKVASIQKVANIRKASVESNLIFALRHLQIQLSSGVPIQKSMQSIAEGDYGEVSDIFKKAVEKISLGKPVIRTLEEIALKTESESLRKSMSLVINSLSSGGSVADALKSYISSFSTEQQDQIRGYGGVLKIIIIFFILFGAMFPTIGTTIVVAILSLTKMEASFIMSLFIGLELFAILFISLLFLVIKSKRPAVLTV